MQCSSTQPHSTDLSPSSPILSQATSGSLILLVTTEPPRSWRGNEGVMLGVKDPWAYAYGDTLGWLSLGTARNIPPASVLEQPRLSPPFPSQ